MTRRPVAFVTGASRGIGAAAAIAFAEKGYDLGLLGLEQDLLDATGALVRERGGDFLAFAVDLADLADAESALDKAIARWGHIDVLVNNAAWRTHETMRNMSVETWEKTLRVCLTAPAFLARRAAMAMEEQAQGGVILNISSMMSERAAGTSPAYIASKGGLDALTYELGTLYGPAGIRVIAVNPGWIDTEMSADYVTPTGDSLAAKLDEAARDAVPLRRPGTAQEVARALVWLASAEASYVTGTRFLIDGGWTHQHLGYGLKRMQFPEDFP